MKSPQRGEQAPEPSIGLKGKGTLMVAQGGGGLGRIPAGRGRIVPRIGKRVKGDLTGGGGGGGEWSGSGELIRRWTEKHHVSLHGKKLCGGKKTEDAKAKDCRGGPRLGTAGTLKGSGEN